MTDEKKNDPKAREPEPDTDEESKGQFGGLRGLGPKGGSVVEGATPDKTADTDESAD